jgi:hypothetical protein
MNTPRFFISGYRYDIQLNNFSEMYFADLDRSPIFAPERWLSGLKRRS